MLFFSGIVSTAKLLDRETIGSYALKIQVNDDNPERVSLILFFLQNVLHQMVIELVMEYKALKKSLKNKRFRTTFWSSTIN